MLCANTTAKGADVVLDGRVKVKVRVIDDHSWHASCVDPDFFEFGEDAYEGSRLRLRPFAIARIRMEAPKCRL